MRQVPSLLFALAFAASARAATLSLTPESGPPTTGVTVYGQGFAPQDYVSILLDGDTVATAIADTYGGIQQSIQVRASARPGAHEVDAVGSSGTASASFLVRTNWSQFLFDANHSGRNPYENVLSPKTARKLRLLWTAQAGSSGLGGGIHTSIAVVDGVAYVSSQDGNLYAFDAATGSLLWTGDTGYSDSSPAVENGLVHVGTAAGLFTFPASCSTPCPTVWTADTQTTINPAITYAEGTVYASAYSGYVDAFDASSGDPRWSGLVQSFDPVFGPSAVWRGTVYVPGDKGLYAFPADCTTPCEPRWIFRTPYGVEKSPSVVDGVAYVGDDQGTIYAIDAGTGDEIWAGQADALPTSTAVGESQVYVSAMDGRLRAFPRSCTDHKCHPVWTAGFPFREFFDPVVANGVVYAGTIDGYYLYGTLFAFPEECSNPCHPIWSYALDGAVEQPPTVADGVVYVGTLTGKVYAFGLTAVP